jgi:hypothetical protein
MAISPAALMHADIAALRASADRWADVTVTVDAVFDVLSQAGRDLSVSWPSGPAAQAAQDSVQDLRRRLGDIYDQIAVDSRALRHFADEITYQRQALVDVLQNAESDGVHINLVYEQFTSDRAAQQVVEGYMLDVNAVRERAGDLDQVTSETLVRGYVPDTADSVPVFDPAGSGPSALLALSGCAPTTRGDFWRNTHPVNHDDLIAKYPEVIGTLDGLPSGVRDAANRIVLERQKAGLLTRQQELAAQVSVRPLPENDDSNVYDRGLQQDLAEVNGRLTGISALEKRLADPAQHLISYRPGDEQDAVVDTQDEWDPPID